jgi:hypothetical protein
MRLTLVCTVLLIVVQACLIQKVVNEDHSFGPFYEKTY